MRLERLRWSIAAGVVGEQFDRRRASDEHEAALFDRNLASPVTRTIPLDDVVSDGFEQLAANTGDDIKVLVDSQEASE
jgi:hypothetical protein